MDIYISQTITIEVNLTRRGRWGFLGFSGTSQKPFELMGSQEIHDRYAAETPESKCQANGKHQI